MPPATIKPITLIESPLSHARQHGRRLHRAYLEMCFFDSIQRGEVPLATHKLYTDALDDQVPSERKLGMEMLFYLLPAIDQIAVYFDVGVSDGMIWGIMEAKKRGIVAIEPRSLYGHPTPYPLMDVIKGDFSG